MSENTKYVTQCLLTTISQGRLILGSKEGISRKSWKHASHEYRSAHFLQLFPWQPMPESKRYCTFIECHQSCDFKFEHTT